MARQALLTMNVLPNIAQFQSGVYKDLQAFAHLEAPKLSHYDIQPSFDALDEHLDPWYSEYGVSRLSLLLSTWPHMRRIVRMHATYFGKLNVLQFIHEDHDGLVNCGDFLVDLAAWAGQPAVIEYLVSIGHPGYTTHAMFLASKYGYLDVIKILHAGNMPGTVFDMNIAAANGDLDVLKFFHENSTDGCSSQAMDNAAANGHLETVKWLHENRTEGCTWEAMNLAARNGHLETLKWLHENRTEGCTYRAMCLAAKNGHLDVVKFLHDNRTEGVAFEAMRFAASNGHIDIMEFLHTYRTEGFNPSAICEAAYNGQLDAVKWLHANTRDFSHVRGSPIDSAAAGGHLEIVEYLMSAQSYSFTFEAIEKSIPHPSIFKLLLDQTPCHSHVIVPQLVKAGNLDLLRFVSNDSMACEMLKKNAQTYIEAAVKMGRSDLVEWLLQYGTMECSKATLHHAMVYRHEDVILLLLKKNLVPLDSIRFFIDSAAEHGFVRIIQYLHRQSTSYRESNPIEITDTIGFGKIRLCSSRAMDMAAARGHFEIVKFLHFNRSEGCTELALRYAAGNGHKEIVDFLLTHRTEGCIDSAIQAAADYGHYFMMRYLYAYRKDESTAFMLDEAASRGHLKILDFLYANANVRCTLKAFEGAVLNGHVEVAQWLLKHSGVEPFEMMAVVAGRAVRCLHGEYCFDKEPNIMWSSVNVGGLDVIRYVIQHASLRVEDLRFAAEGALRSGQLDVFKLLLPFVNPEDLDVVPKRPSEPVAFDFYRTQIRPSEVVDIASDWIQMSTRAGYAYYIGEQELYDTNNND